MVKKRRKRNDRNHILYRLTLIETGETYIGLSAMIGQARKKTLAKTSRRNFFIGIAKVDGMPSKLQTVPATRAGFQVLHNLRLFFRRCVVIQKRGV